MRFATHPVGGRATLHAVADEWEQPNPGRYYAGEPTPDLPARSHTYDARCTLVAAVSAAIAAVIDAHDALADRAEPWCADTGGLRGAASVVDQVTAQFGARAELRTIARRLNDVRAHAVTDAMARGIW